MSQDVIIGTGMAACGAAHAFDAAGRRPLLFDKNAFRGGHTASYRHDGGWIFDDGPHISFTKVERMQQLFAASVDEQYEVIQAHVNNHWRGHWIKHPAAANLHGLPTELVVKILTEFATLDPDPGRPPANYAEWLEMSYGPTFATTFPTAYGTKYHTVTPDKMSTDWLGDRLYRPALDEAIRGALTPETPHTHYISHFRYPSHGGFFSYLESFLERGEVKLDHEVVEIDPAARSVRFANGASVDYRGLVSSIPLPAVVKLIKGCPAEVLEAASKLAWTKGVIVNLGVGRPDFSPAHWTYFYDDDYETTRISCPHMLSPNTVPEGCGSVQAEIYFSDKYKPLTKEPTDYIEIVRSELIRCGLLREDDEILFSNAYLTPWAQIIFDLERAAAVEIVHGYLDEIGVHYCGRYGEWGYQWTDESFMSGEAAAERVLAAS